MATKFGQNVLYNIQNANIEPFFEFLGERGYKRVKIVKIVIFIEKTQKNEIKKN